MSHLFVKKGVMTSDVAKQVKVNFAPGGVNKLAEEKKKSRRLKKKRSGWRGNHKWFSSSNSTPVVLIKRLSEKRVSIRSERALEARRKEQAEKQVVAGRGQLLKVDNEVEEVKSKHEVITSVIESLQRIKGIADRHDSMNTMLKEFLNILHLSEELFEKYRLKDLMMQRMMKIYSKDYRPKEVFEEWMLDGLYVSIEVLKLVHKVNEKVIDIEDDGFRMYITDIEYILGGCVSPTLTNFALNDWDHEDPAEMIKMFSRLETILPTQIYFDLLDNVVVRVLIKRIDHWEMDEALLYPHLWVQPWISMLNRDSKKRGRGIFDRLKSKFRKILREWTPGDQYASKLLMPWKEIFPKNMWEDLLYLDILPKIVFSLESLDANPANMRTECLAYFIEWSEYVPDELVEDVINEYVVEKIRLVVDGWKGRVKREDGIEWIEGWVLLFEGSSQKVQDLLREALCTIIVECWP